MSSKIPEDVKARVRSSARHACGYCLAQQRYTLLVLEIEHIKAKAKGGTDEEWNLWLACRLCNNAKGVQTHARDPLTGRRVKLFNPRTQHWRRHFKWSEDGIEIIGRTAIGRATVVALRLNNEIALMVRWNSCPSRLASARHVISASLLQQLPREHLPPVYSLRPIASSLKGNQPCHP